MRPANVPSCQCCPTSCRSGYSNNGVTGCTETQSFSPTALTSCSHQVCETSCGWGCTRSCYNGNYLPSSGSTGSGGSMSCADRPIIYGNRRCYEGSERVCKDIDGNGVCVCGANYRVQSNECVPCPTGYANGAGDNPSGSDTDCDVCAENFYVSAANTCTACPGTLTRPAGDDNSAGITTKCKCEGGGSFFSFVDISDSTCADGTVDVGETCTGITCGSADAYDIHGGLSCDDQGVVSNTLVCLRHCEGTGGISNGDDSMCPSRLKSGESCTPSCNSGYTISGSRSCNDGAMTDTAQCSADPCNDAALPISFGSASPCPNTLASGSTCAPTCNTGYTLSGTRSCAAGTLTDTAVCNGNSCDASTAVANGALNDCTSTLAHGASCTPTCNTGYTRSGTRSCAAGTLTDTVVCNPDPCTPDENDPSKNGDDGVFYCINGGTVSGTTGSCLCTDCKEGFGGSNCGQAGACSTSDDPDKDGSDSIFWCINGGTVGGTATACTCTCKDWWDGLSCEIAKACTASSDDQAKDRSHGVLYCSAQYGTIGGTTGDCTCTCQSGYGGSGCETAGACSASTDSSKDGTDGSIYCINTGGTAGGTAGSCTCTCKPGHEGNGCDTASACTASSDSAKDGTDGTLHCSELHGTIGGTTGNSRVHVTRDTREAAVRLPGLAPPPQTRLRMEPTVLSTASTAVLLVEQPGRASARANPVI